MLQAEEHRALHSSRPGTLLYLSLCIDNLVAVHSCRQWCLVAPFVNGVALTLPLSDCTAARHAWTSPPYAFPRPQKTSDPALALLRPSSARSLTLTCPSESAARHEQVQPVQPVAARQAQHDVTDVLSAEVDRQSDEPSLPRRADAREAVAAPLLADDRRRRAHEPGLPRAARRVGAGGRTRLGPRGAARGRAPLGQPHALHADGLPPDRAAPRHGHLPRALREQREAGAAVCHARPGQGQWQEGGRLSAVTLGCWPTT